MEPSGNRFNPLFHIIPPAGQAGHEDQDNLPAERHPGRVLADRVRHSEGAGGRLLAVPQRLPRHLQLFARPRVPTQSGADQDGDLPEPGVGQGGRILLLNRLSQVRVISRAIIGERDPEVGGEKAQ